MIDKYRKQRKQALFVPSAFTPTIAWFFYLPRERHRKSIAQFDMTFCGLKDIRDWAEEKNIELVNYDEVARTFPREEQIEAP